MRGPAASRSPAGVPSPDDHRQMYSNYEVSRKAKFVEAVSHERRTRGGQGHPNTHGDVPRVTWRQTHWHAPRQRPTAPRGRGIHRPHTAQQAEMSQVPCPAALPQAATPASNGTHKRNGRSGRRRGRSSRPLLQFMPFLQCTQSVWTVEDHVPCGALPRNRVSSHT